MNSYDHITSKHYAAYRPPLHRLILEKCIKKEVTFELGLDIGCGTGQSSKALLSYCKKIIGIDPSLDMIKEAIPNPKICYQHFDGQNLRFQDLHFDIITFAGSLFYGKSQRLLDEVIRVGYDHAVIIIYDFEILFDELYNLLGIENSVVESDYNHFENFSGLDVAKIKLLNQKKEDIMIEVLPSDLAHLLLSVREIYRFFLDEFGTPDPFSKLIYKLDNLTYKEKLKVNIYYSIYQKI